MTKTQTAAQDILTAVDDKAREFATAGVDTFTGARETILSYLAANDPQTFQVVAAAMAVTR